jgi:hypothetical protein
LRISRALVALGAAASGAVMAVAPGAWAKDPKVIVFPGNDASAVRPDAGTVSRIPPDPPPMVSRKQWVFDLRYDKGDVYMIAVHPLDLGVPQETSRAMGRFAIELFEGPTLIERVRFDFPMLGAGAAAADGGYMAPPSFEAKLKTRIGVIFPASPRGTRLELWDRATDKRWNLPWPIEDTAAAPAANASRDGGVDSGG